MNSVFLRGPLPRILAHRGLALDAPENTLGAIAAAVDSGRVIIETDVRATSDGIAVLLHDNSVRFGARNKCDLLAPVQTGPATKISDLYWAEIAGKPLSGDHTIPRLRDALVTFPDSRFNIDVKSMDAAIDTARAIYECDAYDRVLITSFSRRRRRATVAELIRMSPSIRPSSIAQSASSAEVIAFVLASALGFSGAIRRLARQLVAVQVPERYGLLRIVTPGFIRRLHEAGVEIHVWTVNDSPTMTRLIAIGVDGIVTDRCDIAHASPDFTAE